MSLFRSSLIFVVLLVAASAEADVIMDRDGWDRRPPHRPYRQVIEELEREQQEEQQPVVEEENNVEPETVERHQIIGSFLMLFLSVFLLSRTYRTINHFTEDGRWRGRE